MATHTDPWAALMAENVKLRAEVERLRASANKYCALTLDQEGHRNLAEVEVERLTSQRDHARFMAAGWKRLAKLNAELLDDERGGHGNAVDGWNAETARAKRLAALIRAEDYYKACMTSRAIGPVRGARAALQPGDLDA